MDSTVTTFDASGKVIEQRTFTVPPEQENREVLDVRMDQALDGLRSFIALPTPTATQTTAAVKLLCRVAVAVIRIMRNRFDATD